MEQSKGGFPGKIRVPSPFSQRFRCCSRVALAADSRTGHARRSSAVNNFRLRSSLLACSTKHPDSFSLRTKYSLQRYSSLSRPTTFDGLPRRSAVFIPPSNCDVALLDVSLAALFFPRASYNAIDARSSLLRQFFPRYARRRLDSRCARARRPSRFARAYSLRSEEFLLASLGLGSRCARKTLSSRFARGDTVSSRSSRSLRSLDSNSPSHPIPRQRLPDHIHRSRILPLCRRLQPRLCQIKRMPDQDTRHSSRCSTQERLDRRCRLSLAFFYVGDGWRVGHYGGESM